MRRKLILAFAACCFFGGGFSEAEAATTQNVRCDTGERIAAVLYEHASFSGARYPYSRSIELKTLDDPYWDIPGPPPTLDRKLSAVCVPRGATVILYDRHGFMGSKLTLDGPGEFNLHQHGWGDRALSAKISIVPQPIGGGGAAGRAETGRGRLTAPGGAADAPDLPPPDGGATMPRFAGDLGRLRQAYDAARTADSCNRVFNGYREIVVLEDSRERLTGGTVQVGGRQRIARGTVGSLARAWRRQLVLNDKPQCFAPAALEIERQVRIAMLPSTSCEAANGILDDLASRTRSPVHIPNPWAEQVRSKDGTTADLAAYFEQLVREARKGC